MHWGAQRRWPLTALAVILVAGGAGALWMWTLSHHGDPDPGGRLLSGLQTVERAVPADAEVTLQQANEPSWDSCDGRPGTFGWNDATVYVQFLASEEPEALIAQADRALTAAGWDRADSSGTPLGPGARWTRVLSGPRVATAALSKGTRGGGTTSYWELSAVTPPQGQRASGC
jgi:hypothetical protein